MGYDIYIQGGDGKLLAGDENSFRFGYFRMPQVVALMEHFGMVVERPLPSAPALSAYGLTEQDFKSGAQPAQATINRIAEYRAAHQAVMDTAESAPTGIPTYKLRYNDGFLTTAAEIRAALAAYDAHPQADLGEVLLDDSRWPRWTAFLRRAQMHCGFRIY
ncbi:hypothetical protein [Streptomyces triticiradicis]|uniref:Uncharacterized protein n=1 Tax=Streptomyces triticiradicis TaxID=2651189 RepID=A0A7J5DM49_9ACTN|nr:hypothetical protein [Streptomyces triticiradicis]KAB1989821.1 hypothetical protein F8144_05605 [Streptomyces triticiradicis]